MDCSFLRIYWLYLWCGCGCHPSETEHFPTGQGHGIGSMCEYYHWVQVGTLMCFYILAFQHIFGGNLGSGLCPFREFSLFLSSAPWSPAWDHCLLFIFQPRGLLDYSGSVNSNSNPSEGLEVRNSVVS